jgi:hypothetical protein
MLDHGRVVVRLPTVGGDPRRPLIVGTHLAAGDADELVEVRLGPGDGPDPDDAGLVVQREDGVLEGAEPLGDAGRRILLLRRLDVVEDEEVGPAVADLQTERLGLHAAGGEYEARLGAVEVDAVRLRDATAEDERRAQVGEVLPEPLIGPQLGQEGRQVHLGEGAVGERGDEVGEAVRRRPEGEDEEVPGGLAELPGGDVGAAERLSGDEGAALAGPVDVDGGEGDGVARLLAGEVMPQVGEGEGEGVRLGDEAPHRRDVEVGGVAAVQLEEVEGRVVDRRRQGHDLRVAWGRPRLDIHVSAGPLPRDPRSPQTS